MSITEKVLAQVRARSPLRVRPEPPLPALTPTWADASVRRIAAALDRAQQRDAGGWFVVGRSSDVPDGPRAESITRVVAGREIALWRGSDGRLHAGPGACPHMGALLERCPVVGETVLCRWHGMALADGRHGYREHPAYDDGVLAWVRLPTSGETPAPTPRLTQRPDPERTIAAVYVGRMRCEPADVIANRLDPWHGAWFHPYAFSHLTVDESASDADRLVLDVTFRLGRTFGVPVRASFHTPDSRTIVMTILDGEGTGSVVETHATPLGTDRDGAAITVLTEATIATSDRLGFRMLRPAARLVRPLIVRTAAGLWRDDQDYAERRYAVRRNAERRGEAGVGKERRG